MTTAYNRKKEPERIRRALIESSARMAAQIGFAKLSLQMVADAVGVTKGAFFHHFPNKEALIKTVVEELVSMLDEEIDALLNVDEQQRGRFTSAYIQVLLNPSPEGHFWAVFTPTLLQDENINKAWNQWLERRLEKHRATDDGVEFEVLRYAADGAWISAPGKTTPNKSSRDLIRTRLTEMTSKISAF
ncbi:MAG: TetR/AcrR family transcriptional regulator [Pantoea sp.]|uniref:TetR/AcrR family transcriptional regulator n=1 Tax=Pantoea sp. TaxID=69393 RepID=UPI0023A41801|nr:TetR/AcrR family transcriptional regulator [Pantoea sp.]MDE1185468.1 TetR/AcrR family transcriptional regulator [Pantoea sp.]